MRDVSVLIILITRSNQGLMKCVRNCLWPQQVIWLNGHRAQSLGSFGLYLWPLWVRVQLPAWVPVLFRKVDINSQQEDDSKGAWFVVARMPTSGLSYTLDVVNTSLIRLWQLATMNFLRNIALKFEKMNWTYQWWLYSFRSTQSPFARGNSLRTRDNLGKVFKWK